MGQFSFVNNVQLTSSVRERKSMWDETRLVRVVYTFPLLRALHRPLQFHQTKVIGDHSGLTMVPILHRVDESTESKGWHLTCVELAEQR